MNYRDALLFLANVKVAYPSAYRNADRDTLVKTAEMWAKTFEELPYPIMEAALDSYTRRSKFPPTVAEIHTELGRIHSEAWQDMNYAAITEDGEKLRLAAYVMEVTEKYLNKKKRSAVPYDAITNAMLARSNAAMLKAEED